MMDTKERERTPPYGTNLCRRVRISCVGITTCDRPRELRRCLLTYAKHFRAYRRSCEIVVIDDSQSEDARASCRDMLRAVGRQMDAALLYAGLEEKREFEQALIQQGAPPALVTFVLRNALLVPSSPGANRNALLLHAAGETLLSCDDDSLCYIADLRRGEQGIDVVSFCGTVSRIAFAANLSAAARSVPRGQCDLIATHQTLLGRPLPDLALQLRSAGQIASCFTVSRFRTGLAAAEGRVFATVSGTLGDPGLPHAAGLMLSKGTARAQFLSSWAGLRSESASRQAVLGVNTPTLSLKGPLITTTVTGFDNRALLPPFVPSGRGEDTFYGMLLKRCFSDACFGYLPIAILHAPMLPRRYGPLPGSPRLVDVLSLLLEACPVASDPLPACRMRAIGRYYAELGTLAVPDFRARFERLTKRWSLARVEQCKQLLHYYQGEPAGWAAELRDWVSNLERCALNPVNHAPAEFGEPDPPEARLSRLMCFVRQMGEAIQAWPDIVSISQGLRAKGIRLGQPLS